MKNRNIFVLLPLCILSTLTGIAIGKLSSFKNVLEMKNSLESNKEKVNKFKGYYNTLNQWLVIKNQGKSIEDYFKKNNYMTSAIYGMGGIGERVYEELKKTDVDVKYFIDKSVINSRLKVFDINDELPYVDVIIVTPIFAFVDIERELSQKVNYPIVSIEDIIYEI